VRGIIFVDLIDHMDTVLGAETVESIIERCELESGGAYTAVEDYPDAELFALVGAFARETGVEVPELLEDAGEALFAALSRRYPQLVEGLSDPFEFLTLVGDVIHSHVVRLYPTAVPPQVSARRDDEGLVVQYASRRALWRFARGMIRGCARHYGRSVHIETEMIHSDGTDVEFRVRYTD
jgi:hypothetical protein